MKGGEGEEREIGRSTKERGNEANIKGSGFSPPVAYGFLVAISVYSQSDNQ